MGLARVVTVHASTKPLVSAAAVAAETRERQLDEAVEPAVRVGDVTVLDAGERGAQFHGHRFGSHQRVLEREAWGLEHADR